MSSVLQVVKHVVTHPKQSLTAMGGMALYGASAAISSFGFLLIGNFTFKESIEFHIRGCDVLDITDNPNIGIGIGLVAAVGGLVIADFAMICLNTTIGPPISDQKKVTVLVLPKGERKRK